MITKDEILSIADETGLTPIVVEKDYMLGWLLAAISANPAFSENWVFKGGTCLKKCYFETYRFSEDLDFTLLDESQLAADFLAVQFTSIAEWLYESCGIELPTERFVFDVYENPRGHLSCEGRVYYVSQFVKGKKSLPKIKLDLTADEVLVLPAAHQTVFHPYSDLPREGIHANCYDFPEVFGEKLRALGERGRPRDLYDVINLYRNDQLPVAPVIKNVLSQKCAFKGISEPTLADMEAYRDGLERNWEHMLGHQLPSLPSLEVYWNALPEFFNWLSGTIEQTLPELSTVSSSGEIYRPLYGQLGLKDLSGGSLEIVRFAAGNRLCVELDYTDMSGDRKKRVIEPYSLRKASNGSVLLYAVRAEDGQIRSYKIERINAVSLTDRVFVPRFQIELSPGKNLGQAQSTMRSPTRLGLPRRVGHSRTRPTF